jgi:hypothetical protein
MLAGVVVTEEGAFPRCVALGTGNKCLGQALLRPDGTAVNDMHAEVVARRGLRTVLLREVRAHVAVCASSPSCALGGSSPLSSSALLTHPPFAAAAAAEAAARTSSSASASPPPLFSLRPTVRLHLYISDSPCGDAAIYEDAERDGAAAATTSAGGGAGNLINNNNSSNDAAAAATSSSSSVSAAAAQGARRTGAKPVGAGAGDEATEPDVVIGASPSPQAPPLPSAGLRTKPGRTDLPLPKRTLSHACSDKIARWCGVGWQGALLSHFLAHPLAITSVIVAPEQAGVELGASVGVGVGSSGKQLDALRRALRGRAARAQDNARAVWVAAAAPGEAAPPLVPDPDLLVSPGPRFPDGRAEVALRVVGTGASATAAAAPAAVAASSSAVNGGGVVVDLRNSRAVGGTGTGAAVVPSSSCISALLLQPPGAAAAASSSADVEVLQAATGTRQGVGLAASQDRGRAPRLSKAVYAEEFERTWRAYCAAVGGAVPGEAEGESAAAAATGVGAPPTPTHAHATYRECKSCAHGLVPVYAAAKAAFHAPEAGFGGWLHADAETLQAFPAVAAPRGGGGEASRKRGREEGDGDGSAGAGSHVGAEHA